MFNNIGIILKRQGEHLPETFTAVVTYLQSQNVNIMLDQTVQESGCSDQPVLNRQALASKADLVIVIGGDGTLLSAARSILDFDVPLVGVNIGRLGFLVDVSPADIDTQLGAILQGVFHEEKRTLLHAHIQRGDHSIYDSSALNDVVLHIRESVRMIEFETYINQQFVHRQRADGMIVSTPTGSTAYALSGGGPLVHPDLDAISLVPICPHTLSNRPIVVPGDSEICIDLLPHHNTCAQIAFDGQNSIDIEANDKIFIRKKEKALRLIHPKTHDYYHILRNKLHWNEQF